MKRLNESHFILAINPEIAYIYHLNKYADYLESKLSEQSKTHKATWTRENNETLTK